jgi:hypothetical protein
MSRGDIEAVTRNRLMIDSANKTNKTWWIDCMGWWEEERSHFEIFWYDEPGWNGHIH